MRYISRSNWAQKAIYTRLIQTTSSTCNANSKVLATLQNTHRQLILATELKNHNECAARRKLPRNWNASIQKYMHRSKMWFERRSDDYPVLECVRCSVTLKNRIDFSLVSRSCSASGGRLQLKVIEIELRIQLWNKYNSVAELKCTD